MSATDARLAVAAVTAAILASPAAAQDMATKTASEIATSAAPAAAPSSSPAWIATLSTGVLARDGDAARPFGVAALSRRIGRGYVRVSATRFETVAKQVDAALPSSFELASIGVGATFGDWFVDGSASAGRQVYGGVTTGLGTRRNQAGDGSGVYGATLGGGRFVRLGRGLYLTPSLSVQYSAQRALQSSLGPAGPTDYAAAERAWTGSITARLDRFFGKDGRHLAGLSVSRVQTTNGTAVAAGAAGGAGPARPGTVSVGDGWFVAGAAASLRVSPRIWLDGSASRTIGAASGDDDVASVGVRIGF